MGEIISFKKLKKKETLKNSNTTLKQYGILIWLYCSKCKSLQYTATKSINGRVHKCGTEVIEIEVPLNLRAEYTICLKNIQILKKIEESNDNKIKSIKTDKIKEAVTYCLESELKMMENLKEANACKKIVPYKWDKISAKKLPIAYINSSGLMVSEFNFKPKQRFQLFGI